MGLGPRLVIEVDLEPGQERPSRTRERMTESLDTAIWILDRLERENRELPPGEVEVGESSENLAAHLERLRRLRRSFAR